MKKLIAIILATVCALTLCACNFNLGELLTKLTDALLVDDVIWAESYSLTMAVSDEDGETENVILRKVGSDYYMDSDGSKTFYRLLTEVEVAALTGEDANAETVDETDTERYRTYVYKDGVWEKKEVISGGSFDVLLLSVKLFPNIYNIMKKANPKAEYTVTENAAVIAGVSCTLYEGKDADKKDVQFYVNDLNKMTCKYVADGNVQCELVEYTTDYGWDAEIVSLLSEE